MSLSDLTDSNPDLLDDGDFPQLDCVPDEVDSRAVVVVHTPVRKVGYIYIYIYTHTHTRFLLYY